MAPIETSWHSTSYVVANIYQLFQAIARTQWAFVAPYGAHEDLFLN